MKINMKVFYKLVVSLFWVSARYAKSIQSWRFVISLQYLQKEGTDKVDCLLADKHQTNIRVDTINLGGYSQKSLK